MNILVKISYTLLFWMTGLTLLIFFVEREYHDEKTHENHSLEASTTKNLCTMRVTENSQDTIRIFPEEGNLIIEGPVNVRHKEDISGSIQRLNLTLDK